MSAMMHNKFSELLGNKLIKTSKISADTGISRTTLTHLYYRRSKQVSLDVLDKLCKYLGCKVGDIIEYGPDPETTGREPRERT